MTFRVGQKVVCVNADRGTLSGKQCRLVLGDVYTVLSIRDTFLGFGLEVSGDPHWHWLAERFRPVVERKTSIEIFTKMLTGKRVDA